MNRGGAGRRNIDDPGVRQCVLEAEARAALLRSGLIAALALAAGGVLHCVALVEEDHPVEIGAQPIDDLFYARSLVVTGVGSQRGVGGEQDTFRQPDRRPLTKARKRCDQQAFLSERRPIALGVLEQLVGLRHPDRATAALEPVVEQDASDLSALAGAGAVAKEPAPAKANRILGVVGRGGDDIEGLVNLPRSARKPPWASPARMTLSSCASDSRPLGRRECGRCGR